MSRDTNRLDSEFFRGLGEVLADNYSLRSLGHAIGVDPSTASDRKKDSHTWRFDEIAALADLDPQVREIAAARFALRGGTKDVDTPKAAYDLIENAGDMIAELVRDLADNDLNDAEKRRVLIKGLKLRDVLDRLIKKVDSDLRKGVRHG